MTSKNADVPFYRMPAFAGVVLLCLWIGPERVFSAEKSSDELWVLKPVVQPEIPAGAPKSANPIDAFIQAQSRKKELGAVGRADKSTLLRRVYLDLIGIPPTPAEQEDFIKDSSPDAYENVVDRLLASEQHGVRYARHWLDAWRYADMDERMIASQGIYLWRDWLIHTLNEDVPYDQIVRAQLTGYRSTERTLMSATGYRSPVEPRPDDMFARGFLARGAVVRDGKEGQELSIMAVETISTAFMGLTVGCAKCHDHMYDPIRQRDFYAMKALFDPLVTRKVTLATAEQIAVAGKVQAEAEKKRAEIEGPLKELTEPYKKKLYEERVLMLPADVRAVIRKPEKERTVSERKIADDYFPILRIDSDKISEIMPAEERQKYKDLQKQLGEIGTGKRGGALPAFWTVEIDHNREREKSYILTSGDPERPEKNHEVEPGWPFAPAKIDFSEGRVEAFSDWLTAPENPLFARVAVNRLWQWHFAEGLQKTPSDFGAAGGVPSNPELLDWLAAEFVKRKFSMKKMHRLIVTSEVYQRASDGEGASTQNAKADPRNDCLWHFPLQRLEAEPIWDSILSAAGNLDLSVGGPSFDVNPSTRPKRGVGKSTPAMAAGEKHRRAAYMTRGFSTSRDVLSNFLQAFDVDDGRVPCPMRTQTVTAPQALFMMNSTEIERASGEFGERLKKEADGDLKKAVDLGYRIALSRPPTTHEGEYALAYLDNDSARLKNFAWLLFNLDEFIYVR